VLFRLGYDPYSSSKGCAELVASAYRNSFFNPARHAEHGVAVASVRAGNVIGGGDWATDRLIPDFMRAILSGQAVVIRSPHAVRPWQHVLEPLRGYLTLAERLHAQGPEFAEGWNFGPLDNDARDVEWIVGQLTRLWGEDAAWRLDDRVQPHEAHYLKLDISKARLRLGWEPRWRLEHTLESIVAWYRAWQRGDDIRAFSLAQIEAYQRA
jgi:CDP-glucose 4,6-dehydratase